LVAYSCHTQNEKKAEKTAAALFYQINALNQRPGDLIWIRAAQTGAYFDSLSQF